MKSLLNERIMVKISCYALIKRARTDISKAKGFRGNWRFCLNGGCFTGGFALWYALMGQKLN
jgi:hypothetical protein